MLLSHYTAGSVLIQKLLRNVKAVGWLDKMAFKGL